MNRFCFAFITDQNYLNFTLAAIFNLLKTKNDNSLYKIYLIYSNENKVEKIMDFKNYGFINFEIEIIYFDSELIASFNGIRHVSKATYIKYFLPKLINEENILFLDADIYINNNIESIWEDFSKDFDIMAVEDPGYKSENFLIGIGEEEETFNAGVLLLNLESMRKKNLCKKLIEYTNENSSKIQNADQTVFNVICKNTWKNIPLKFNTQRIHFINTAKQLKIDKKTLEKSIANPFIVHFTTHSKPWMFRCAHPYKKKYLKNYKQLFRFKYNDITIMNGIKKIYEFLQYFRAYFTINLRGYKDR